MHTNTPAKKILIIEDDVILSSTLADNLVYEGFAVTEARDGEEGVMIALRERPDIILLDILLPKKDGLSVLRELRKDTWGKDVPVVVLSNLSNPSGIATAIEADVNEYLVKVDWKIDEVIKRIREKLNM